MKVQELYQDDVYLSPFKYSKKINEVTKELTIVLTGDFMSPSIRINGQKIMTAFDGTNTWKRKFCNIVFDAPINFDIRAIGTAGMTWSLKVSISGKKALNLTETLQDQHLVRHWEIPIF